MQIQFDHSLIHLADIVGTPLKDLEYHLRLLLLLWLLLLVLHLWLLLRPMLPSLRLLLLDNVHLLLARLSRISSILPSVVVGLGRVLALPDALWLAVVVLLLFLGLISHLYILGLLLVVLGVLTTLSLSLSAILPSFVSLVFGLRVVAAGIPMAGGGAGVWPGHVATVTTR